MKKITRDHCIKLLKRYINKEHGSQRAAAKYWGVHERTVSKVLTQDDMPIPLSMLKSINVEGRTKRIYYKM